MSLGGDDNFTSEVSKSHHTEDKVGLTLRRIKVGMNVVDKVGGKCQGIFELFLWWIEWKMCADLDIKW